MLASIKQNKIKINNEKSNEKIIRNKREKYKQKVKINRNFVILAFFGSRLNVTCGYWRMYLKYLHRSLNPNHLATYFYI